MKIKLIEKIKREIPSPYIFLGIGLFIIFILFLSYFQLELEPMSAPKSQIVEIHYADNISDSHLELIEGFNEKYKGRIKVIPINLPFSKFSTNERKELLARSLRSKSEKIDVFAADIVWGYRFSKWAENLSPYIDEEFMNSLISENLPTCYYEDELFALPLTIDLGTMYYRDDLIKQFTRHENLEEKLSKSITWEEFIRLGNEKSKKASPFYLFPAADYEGLICSYVELLLNQNRDYFNVNRFDLTSKESLKALQTLKDLIYKHKLTSSEVTSFTEYPCHEHFIENDGMFLHSWPTFISDYRDRFKKDYPDLSFKRAPIPHFKGTKPAAVFGGWNLIVSKFSSNKKEAVQFIKYLLKPESQKILFHGNGSLPVLEELYKEHENIENGETLEYYQNQFKHGVHRPLHIDYTRISDIITYYLHKSLNNELGAEEALQKATEKIQSREVLLK